jgi:hypothetical protein
MTTTMMTTTVRKAPSPSYLVESGAAVTVDPSSHTTACSMYIFQHLSTDDDDDE